ncbi:MAG: phosphoribosylglycinamide formyltransferase [Actinomycetota bacterium]|nr:phosphoribosylglycinamide formyltransferase [Actinomycetota bacterium]
MNPSRYPVAVLVSGGGTNLQAILDAEAEPGFSAEVVVVISDRPSVKALDRARSAGIAAIVVDWTDYPDRTTFSAAICDEAARHGARALILAGFMRILAPEAMRRFPDRIINVHPALLPAFPGAHAVPQAIEHGVKVTGVTVHFVDEQVDHGPIIAQEAVAVLPDDDEATLHARLQDVEHRLFPQVVDALGRGSLRVEGRRVTWVGR